VLLNSLLLSAALGAEPPSVDQPAPSGARSWRDAMVVIGVEDYRDIPDMPYAIADARAFEAWFRSRGPSKRRIFIETNPTDEQMRQALKRGTARVRSRGTLWVYYSGQGFVGDDGVPRILPTDVAPNGRGQALSLPELEAQLARSRAERVVLIVDAPFDGSERGEMTEGKPMPKELEWATGESDKVVVWVADTQGSGDLFAPAGHGLFTWLALGGLQGWADVDGDGVVQLWEAQEFTHESTALLGRDMTPSVDQRAAPRLWAMSMGELRADAPSPTQWLELSVQDRDRRMEQAVVELQDQALDDMLATLARIKQGDPLGAESLERFIDRWQHQTVTVRWVPPITAVNEARVLLQDPEALLPSEPTVASTDGGDTGDEPPPVVDSGPTLSDDSCDDLVGMEPDALMGIFSPGRIACVEARLAESSQTDKDKLSRLLLADAESKGEGERWQALMLRHLDEISRADPDLCYAYARHLSQKGVAQGEEVIRWADYALENKQRWSGDMYRKRVFSLYRLRAEAANELWKDAEQNLIADPTDANDAQTLKWRGKAKDYSREWLDYAQASEQDPGRALAICVSAAGTKAACEEKPR
jgi:hypothetical protein